MRAAVPTAGGWNRGKTASHTYSQTNTINVAMLPVFGTYPEVHSIKSVQPTTLQIVIDIVYICTVRVRVQYRTCSVNR